MNVQSFDPQALKKDPNISMTDAAKDHFRKQLKKFDKQSVRLFIEESGCSGYMYRVELVDEAQPADLQLILGDDITLFVQASALAILQGTEVDFKKDGLNELVKFNNPNVTGECGCGESFVVESN